MRRKWVKEVPAAHEIREEFCHPFHVDLVVRPPLANLLQHVLSRFLTDSWQNGRVEIIRNRFFVALVQLLRVIVRRFLCAHIVYQRKVGHVVFVVEFLVLV